MSLDRSAPPSPPVRAVADLLSYFREAEKPRAAWRLGMEHEKLGVERVGLRAPTFDGDDGIERVLRALGERGEGEPFVEDGKVIALTRGVASVTLEPGGQLELSGAPVARLAEAKAELDGHLARLEAASAPLGLVWLALGYRPFGTRDDMPWMPKGRYAAMKETLGPRGRLALDMMLMTGTVQANLDWSDEADLASKFGAAQRVSPLVSALYANSPFQRGAPGDYLTFRYQVWRETDASRCGLLPAGLEPGFGYAAYAEWAVDVPMLFLRRSGYVHLPAGYSFRRFMREGYAGHTATLSDFADHLTTLFPEVRVKRVLEVRGADVVSPALMLAHAALWKGLLYSADARAAAAKLTGGADWSELSALSADVAHVALRARLGRRSVVELARELVALARSGLVELVRDGLAGDDEPALLDPLADVAASGVTPAERAVAAWEAGGRTPDALIAHARVA